MANKTITWTEPTTANIQNIQEFYDGGVLSYVTVAFSIDTTDPDEATKYRTVTIAAAQLPGARVTALNNLVADAITFIKNKMGF